MEEQEVPTEHLHESLHHAAHGGERWIFWVALTSALLAALAAVSSLKAGHYANEAMLAQIEASDQWSFYQSKSIKEAQLHSKMEILAALGKPTSEADAKKATEYAGDKQEIQKKAEDLNRDAKTFLHIHQGLAHSVTMFQVAIAVGAISVLAKRRPFWYVSMLFGVAGLAFMAHALYHALS